MAIFKAREKDQLSWEEAAHLIRRCSFGATEEEINLAMQRGLKQTVAHYFEKHLEPENLNYMDRGVQNYLGGENIEPVASWWFMRMVLTQNPLYEKMVLFWHGHFATSARKIHSPRLMFNQMELFRKDPFGSFESLLHQISKDPAMIYWLDNNSNSKEQPNENFARELMELFSLGIGNYSEKDIQEAARAFTGWFVHENRFRFSRRSHDTGNKTIFGKVGAFSGEEVVSLCASHPASKKFLAKKLLSFFVQANPPESAIQEFAQLLEQSKFTFAEPLKTLFQSEWFFAPENQRMLIRGPVDLIVGTIRVLQLSGNIHEAEQLSSMMGQSLLRPPNVKGWDGDRTWINAATLLARQHLAYHASQYSLQQGRLQKYIEKSPEETVLQLCHLLVPGTLPKIISQKMIEYYQQASPDSRPQYLAGLLEAILTLPEYQVA